LQLGASAVKIRTAAAARESGSAVAKGKCNDLGKSPIGIAVLAGACGARHHVIGASGAGGCAVQVANSSLNVTSVLLDQSRTTSDPTGGEVLGVFAQNPDGSAGNVVFQNFSLSYNPANGVTTATASAPLILAANTAYWLRLDTTTSNNIIWNALHAPTSPNEFTSAFGVTYASPDSVTITDSTAGTQYGPTVDGPPVIQINGTAIPEPAGMLLVSGAALAGLLTRSKRQF
jgi:hypothetical protein